MCSYTIRDLGMNVSGQKFILPFDVSVPDEGILEKTRDLFTEKRILYFVPDKSPVDISEKWNTIHIPCMYAGNDGYYFYTLVLTVFRIKYANNQRLYEKNEKNDKNENEVKDGQWMIAMYVECSDGALLEELIDIKVFPSLINELGLKNYV